MEFKKTILLTTKEKTAILSLWNQNYPKSLLLDGLTGLENYLADLNSPHHILLLENDKVLGWYFDFFRANERWFALIIDQKVQGKGLGHQLLTHAQKQRTILNGWVIDHNNSLLANGLTYQSPLAFYLKNGFQLIPDMRLETPQISAVKIKWIKPE